MRILVVEDSTRLSESLRMGLRKLGHAVDVAGDGASGLTRAMYHPYDVIILDLMLPEMDGLSVLRELREMGRDVCVLILTAKDTVDDRVRGLRQGADDYLIKPFSFDELVARVEALGRRHLGATKPTLVIGDLHIDTGSHRVTRSGKEIELTPREYTVLRLLASKRGEVVSRREIEDHLYDEESFPMSNAVQSAISNLRARLSVPNGEDLIHTRRGLGYVLDSVSA